MMITVEEARKLSEAFDGKFGKHDTYSILEKIEDMITTAAKKGFYSIQIHEREIPNADAIMAFFSTLGYMIIVDPNMGDVITINWFGGKQ